jgi:hypothetical protein
MELFEHRPTLDAVDVLMKARQSGDATAIHKGEISLVDALSHYVSDGHSGQVATDGKDEAVIRLVRIVLAALASSDVPFQSGSPVGAGFNRRTHNGGPLGKELADPLGDDADPRTVALNAKLLKDAARGLNARATFITSVQQDMSEPEPVRKAREARLAGTGRKASGWNDPTGDDAGRAAFDGRDKSIGGGI